MRKFQFYTYETLAIVCFVGFCLMGCTTLKYVAPTRIENGIATGGETFELKKRFVLTKVTGFKVKRDNAGMVEASFDTVENADSKAVDALSDFAKTALSMATKAP